MTFVDVSKNNKNRKKRKSKQHTAQNDLKDDSEVFCADPTILISSYTHTKTSISFVQKKSKIPYKKTIENDVVKGCERRHMDRSDFRYHDSYEAEI